MRKIDTDLTLGVNKMAKKETLTCDICGVDISENPHSINITTDHQTTQNLDLCPADLLNVANGIKSVIPIYSIPVSVIGMQV